MGCFRTADGHVNIAPMPGAWGKFCAILGIPQLAEDDDFRTAGRRVRHRERVNRAVEAVTVTRTSAEWIDLLNKAGIPCGPIYSVDQTFDDPQVRHLGIAQTVASPVMGEQTLVGQAVHLSRTDSRIASATPELGEHTDQVLSGIGFTPAEIAGLRERNIV
jgi:formyl-CoA transferase